MIELLVVIAVIGLLIGILLPSLGKARDAGRTVKCMTNMKQIGVGLAAYALDYKGRIWESGAVSPYYRFWYVQTQNPLASPTAAAGPNPVVPGPAFSYLSDVDKIFECPTNQRRTPTSSIVNLSDSFWNTPAGQLQAVLFKVFLEPRALNFDYTMVTGASGANVDSSVQIAWDRGCRTYTAQQARPNQPAASNIAHLRSCPVFMEEDSLWYNSDTPDGLWSNWDHLTNRHANRGHVVYANGEVELGTFPRGKQPTVQNEIGNFTANDVWALGRGGRWFQVAPSWPTVVRTYGWINGPK